MTVEAPAETGLDAGRHGDGPATTRSGRRRREQRRRRIVLGAYGLAVAALAVLIPVLGYIGARAVLDSSDGQAVDPVLNPSEPGYRALVPPSPTLLVFQTDDQGGLVGVALLSLTGDDEDGGGVLLVPPSTVADLPNVGRLTIDASFSFSGAEAAEVSVEWALHVGVDEMVVVSASEWADLLEGAGPLTVTNPDQLVAPEEGEAFPAGPLELAPADVPAYSAFLAPEENRVNRLLRQQLVWDAWLDRLAADPSAGSFPGEQGRGLARFLPGIASGAHSVETMPIDVDAELPGQDPESAFEPDHEELQELIPRLVPFPAGAASGVRPLVRVLAGTEDRSTIFPAARRVVEAGGQVVMVGNADRFGHETTEILYFDPLRRADANDIADELGFGSVTRVDEIDDSAEIIVVLGADAEL